MRPGVVPELRRARRAQAVRLTVRAGTTMETVPANAALETTTLGNALDIHALAGGEHIGQQLLADLEILNALHANLAQNAQRRQIRVAMAQMANLALGQAAGLGLAEAELNGGVAVLLERLDLCDVAGTCLDDGDRNHCASACEQLRHAHLAAQNTLHNFLLGTVETLGGRYCVARSRIIPVPYDEFAANVSTDRISTNSSKFV